MKKMHFHEFQKWVLQENCRMANTPNTRDYCPHFVMISGGGTTKSNFLYCSYKLSKEKQVKLLKIDFQKKSIENTFFRCSARLSFGSSPVEHFISFQFIWSWRPYISFHFNSRTDPLTASTVTLCEFYFTVSSGHLDFWLLQEFIFRKQPRTCSISVTSLSSFYSRYLKSTTSSPRTLSYLFVCFYWHSKISVVQSNRPYDLKNCEHTLNPS